MTRPSLCFYYVSTGGVGCGTEPGTKLGTESDTKLGTEPRGTEPKTAGQTWQKHNKNAGSTHYYPYLRAVHKEVERERGRWRGREAGRREDGKTGRREDGKNWLCRCRHICQAPPLPGAGRVGWGQVRGFGTGKVVLDEGAQD